MRNKLRIITRLILYVLIINLFLGNSAVVFAANTPQINILSANQNTTTGKITVQASISNSSSNQEITILVCKKDTDYKISSNIFYIDQHRPAINKDGVFSISFYMKNEVEAGQYTVYMGGTNVQNTSVFHFDIKPINQVLCGDADNNGKIDIFDSLYLARYLAEWPEYSAISPGADVDGNVGINIFDSLYLARYLAEWPGYVLPGPAVPQTA